MARQALTIAGAVVGTMFGAPQLGFAIGSLIGNAVDPVTVQGPKIGDLAVQTSRDGVPRPIVFGTAAVTGNIIDRSAPKIVKKKERSGKGGPVTVTERVYMSYAIRVCEGPATSISRIWENEKLVYDATPGSTIVKDSTKFLTKVTFYMGEESQLPDPTLEAIHGVGSTPAHRGTCYAVWKDKDLTDFGGAIPQYRFEVNGPAYFTTPSVGTTKSLVHFDGTNGSTTIVDSIGEISWTTYSTTLSTTDKKFGASSLYKTAGNRCNGSVNYTVADTQDYCFEFFINFSAFGSGSDTNKNRFFAAMGIILSVTSGQIVLEDYYGTDVQTYSHTALTTGVWYHVAIQKSGGATGTITVYLNGVSIGTGNYPTRTYWNLIGVPWTIYLNGGPNNLDVHSAYLDEFRFKYGVIYSGTFTPPTSAFTP